MSTPGLVPSPKPKPDALAISLGTAEPTWQQALRVWWSWQWRFFIATVLITWAVRVWLPMVGGALGLTAEYYFVTEQIVIFIPSALVSLYLFKDILDRDFGSFRACVIPKENVSEEGL